MGNWRDTYYLWIAQGFGVGRIPIMPGTFGSLLGLLWFALLLQTGNLWYYMVGLIGGLAVSVWLCGAGERILRQTDPGSIVLDEIAAMPLCFSSFILVPLFRHGQWLSPESFFTGSGWRTTLLVFVLYRILDMLKPWPIATSQKLPGGWGVTMDDVLAAVGVAVVTLPLAW